MNKPRTCRRAHARTAANTRKQTNENRLASGKVVKYVTHVCVACAKYRYALKYKGQAVKDLRKGAR